MEENKKVIGVAQVLQHLKDGMTRDEIAEHYGITKAECREMFKDERLKGKKTHKKKTVSYVLVEDATDDISVEAEEVKAEETSTDETQKNVEETTDEKQSYGSTTTDELEESESDDIPQSPGPVEPVKSTWT